MTSASDRKKEILFILLSVVFNLVVISFLHSSDLNLAICRR